MNYSELYILFSIILYFVLISLIIFYKSKSTQHKNEYHQILLELGSLKQQMQKNQMPSIELIDFLDDLKFGSGLLRVERVDPNNVFERFDP